MSNNVEESAKTKPVFCWRCRQSIIRGSKRTHRLFEHQMSWLPMGCKKIQQRTIKTSQKIKQQ
ncbi:MAG TPA: hypothetical protein IAB70_00195 [Candidatus Merdicola faecigallinarum]|uniref:Uncharacterized protein n=1 Tax=Candidatus Merdicola faecigallinarum TaxID=2840862 RepID=A0A9D1LZP2_9FIRM|nr:hypothetical protein [Candidatus Merdicola faecigallinarum]